MLNYPVIYPVSDRDSDSKHARNSVYLSKIENSSYPQELVSHSMPEHVDELIRKNDESSVSMAMFTTTFFFMSSA